MSRKMEYENAMLCFPVQLNGSTPWTKYCCLVKSELSQEDRFDLRRVNSLWPSDALWWYRSGSTFSWVMIFCWTAPSHYLDQCWFIINEVLWHWRKTNFKRSAQYIDSQRNGLIKLLLYLSWANELSQNTGRYNTAHQIYVVCIYVTLIGHKNTLICWLWIRIACLHLFIF